MVVEFISNKEQERYRVWTAFEAPSKSVVSVCDCKVMERKNASNWNKLAIFKLFWSGEDRIVKESVEETEYWRRKLNVTENDGKKDGRVIQEFSNGNE